VDFSNKKVKHGDEKQGQTILSAISIQYVSDDENSDDYNRVEGDVGNFRRCRQWKLKNPQKG
jgi:hypothetical protein